MRVRVKRVTFNDYTDLVKANGPKAHFFDVPSTLDGVKFRGVYTSSSCDEVAVAWPVDRPVHAQEEFSKEAACGQPIEDFDIADNLN